MAASITVHLKVFKHPQLPCVSTNLDETGIKIHGLLRSFISNIVIISVAVPFKAICMYYTCSLLILEHKMPTIRSCMVNKG